MHGAPEMVDMSALVQGQLLGMLVQPARGACAQHGDQAQALTLGCMDLAKQMLCTDRPCQSQLVCTIASSNCFVLLSVSIGTCTWCI